MSENGRELRSTAGARMKGIIKDILADSDNETENQSGEDSEPNKNGAIPQSGVLRDNVPSTTSSTTSGSCPTEVGTSKENQDNPNYDHSVSEEREIEKLAQELIQLKRQRQIAELKRQIDTEKSRLADCNAVFPQAREAEASCIPGMSSQPPGSRRENPEHDDVNGINTSIFSLASRPNISNHSVFLVDRIIIMIMD
ncbi:hypothetical protein SNE40_018447 [Patella caerulea]|uniref:Uncharacterized protein n=1 Tax=Patella caerulea TaxID=87958 RepID=A0AAN8J545_PATCE